MSNTRERILQAALGLIHERPDAVPSMSSVARATGISRQALYLHFADHATLLRALAEHVDEREGLGAGIAAVEAAPDGSSQMRAWVAMQAARNPRIATLARALDATRHGEASSTAAWRDRLHNRMRGATVIADRLRDEGRVHESWSRDEAAILLWELASFRVWDDLVNDAGLDPDRYVEIATATALAAMAAPVR